MFVKNQAMNNLVVAFPKDMNLFPNRDAHSFFSDGVQNGRTTYLQNKELCWPMVIWVV